jgi:tetratricopeptide (TPR) repeat protein
MVSAADSAAIVAYLDNAKMALGKGDGEAASVFLGGALAEDPAQAEALFLLDGLFARVDDPLSLGLSDQDEDERGEGGGLSIGEALVRVQALARVGRVADALVLLVSVGSGREALERGRPYLAWTAPLVASAPPGTLGDHELSAILSAWSSHFPGLVAAEAAQPHLAFAQPLLALAEASAAPALWLLAAGLLRKSAEFSRAKALAQRAYDGDASWGPTVSLAMIHRAEDDAEGAVARYREAIDKRPDDQVTRLDLADLYAELGRFAEAKALYDEVLTAAPAHPWAAPSALFARIEMGEPGARQALSAYVAAHPENERAAALETMATPFLGWLPEPVAPLIQAGKQLAKAWHEAAPKEETPVSVTLETQPSPSDVWAFYMLLVRHRIATPPSLSVRRPPAGPWAPDPLPRLRLWRGTPLGPEPGLASAPEEIVEAIGTIARQRFELAAWGAFADVVVEHITPLGLADALSLMVRPPPVPEGVPPWTWLSRVQIAAALVAVRLPGGRQALFDVLWGPDDGTVEAAAVALAESARRDDDARLPVSDALYKRLNESAADSPLRFPLVCAWLLVPGLPEEVRSVLAEYRSGRLSA